MLIRLKLHSCTEAEAAKDVNAAGVMAEGIHCRPAGIFFLQVLYSLTLNRKPIVCYSLTKWIIGEDVTQTQRGPAELHGHLMTPASTCFSMFNMVLAGFRV